MIRAVLLFCLLPISSALACTIFESPFAGDNRFAHNVDWYQPYPNVMGILVANPAGMKKSGELAGAPVKKAEWVSQWRSLTFSIAGAEFPVSGFNEKGLAMGVLELPETKYPEANDPRGALGAGQFVQYNLDRSSSLDEVIASGLVVRPYSSVARMHYFVCEASGDCAVIQYIQGQMKVYRGADLPYPVLTNSLYPASVSAADECMKSPATCAASEHPLSRFSRAAVLRSEIKVDQPFVSQALSALNKVVQTSGGVTRFQLVYDPMNRMVNARKVTAPDLSQLQVNFDDIVCEGPRKIIRLRADTSGDLSQQWVDLTEAEQLEMVLNMGYAPAAAGAYSRFPFHSVSCE